VIEALTVELAPPTVLVSLTERIEVAAPAAPALPP
jgi:hypothetical protein